MADLIDRQAAISAAIEAVDKWDGGYSKDRERMIRWALLVLPSAQSEIIRCKDCKHYFNEIHCDKVAWWNSENDFCSRAERREE